MSIALGDIELSVVGFVEICYPGLIHGYCFFFFFLATLGTAYFGQMATVLNIS